MQQDPYVILGIAPSATTEEIKKAYRAKAFVLHPDKNKAPDAQQQFVALTEAYEEALAQKTRPFKKYTSPFQDAEQYRQREREAAKRRAQEYARMRYEEFEQTEAAQTIRSLDTILNHFMILAAFALLVSIPIVLATLYEFTGLILGLIFFLAVGIPIVKYIKQFFKPAKLWLALMDLVETFFFRFVILTLTNIYLILKVVLNTLIPLEYSLTLFPVLILSCYFGIFKKRENTNRLFISGAILPLILNIIFCINYYASRNPTIEEFPFINVQYESRRGHEKSTMIELEGGRYEEYAGIRIFSSLDIMWNCEHIIYQFEDGLLGVRVMKEYRFIQ